ncbi:ABC transporter ATP-binding protein [Psychromonas hadalis]|uniref:ABC transporter ATP-binding protein n=1 Tax=Psychromonas hadalis TaxID=211669 RepID=UPI00040EB7D1|nr:ABC transporter ATP-binding protein [Psychromonas hadalis]
MNNNKINSWYMLWRLTHGHRAQLTFSLLFTGAAVICEILPYWFIFQAIELLLLPEVNMADKFYELALLLAGALVLKTLFYLIAYALSHKTAYAILQETRKTLVNHLAWAPVSWLHRQRSGQLKQSVLQDVEKLENVIAHHTVEVAAAIFSPLVVSGYLLWIDWRLALAAIFTAPLAVLASSLFMRNSEQLFDQYTQASAALDSATVEYLRNMPVMKVFRQDTKNFRTMRKRLEEYYNLVADLTQKTVPGWTLFSCLLAANIFLILPLGAWLYANSAIELPAVLMAVILGAGMLKPLLKISHFLMEVNDVLAGLRNLQPILDFSPQPTLADIKIGSAVQVCFKDLNFSYSKDSQCNLSNINLNFKPGSFTLLLGPSGAGKSTLVQLLGGLLEPSCGAIYLNHATLNMLDQKQRSQLIAIATQEAFLFQGSIRENMMLARPQASEQELRLALQVAQAQELIDSLPQGDETQLSEHGLNLSGGEKQRIAIARALLANTPVLILDEATAAMDNLTQQAFYRDLKTHYPDKTILMITHRSFELQGSDQIVILEQGKIQAQGTHQQIIQHNLFYQRFWQRQLESDAWSITAANGEGNNDKRGHNKMKEKETVDV